jgi:hypothetical protein
MPGGKPIGVRATGPRASAKIRELPGGDAEAERLFKELTVGATDVTPPRYKGKLVRLPGSSDTVGYTPPSSIWERQTRKRPVTLRLARGLICERGMQVGFPAEDGRHFEAWQLTPEQSLRRIEDEWIALGREPNIGEVAWFTSEP